MLEQATTGETMSNLKPNATASVMRSLRWLYENDHQKFLWVIEYMNDVIKTDEKVVVKTSNALFKRLIK